MIYDIPLQEMLGPRKTHPPPIRSVVDLRRPTTARYPAFFPVETRGRVPIRTF